MTGLTGRSLIRQGFIVLLLALVTGEGVFTGLTIFGLRGRDPEPSMTAPRGVPVHMNRRSIARWKR